MFLRFTFILTSAHQKLYIFVEYALFLVSLPIQGISSFWKFNRWNWEHAILISISLFTHELKHFIICFLDICLNIYNFYPLFILWYLSFSYLFLRALYASKISIFCLRICFQDFPWPNICFIISLIYTCYNLYAILKVFQVRDKKLSAYRP